MHVRDLKKALDERGVKPNEITWRGYRGFCYLHYAKANNGNKTDVVVDDVIEILRTLKIGDDGAEAKLEVKVGGYIGFICLFVCFNTLTTECGTYYSD